MTSQMQRAVRFLQQEPSVWGPIFLLSSVIIAAKAAFSIDLLVTASIGFFLSYRLQVRGMCYALIILGFTSIAKHLMIDSDHLWHLGIQCSLALAFFITALTSEQEANWIESLESQIETGKASFQNLEEELSKVHAETSEQQIAYQERIGALQKELEDLQSEHSSILILNEVLRKKTAAVQEEQEASIRKFLAIESKFEALQGRYELNEKELARIQDNDGMASLNKQLMQELEDSRFDQEQTHLTNETLNRLLTKESLKAKEAESEIDSLKIQLRASHEKVRTLEEPLQEELSKLTRENETLSKEFERTSFRANEFAEKQLKLEDLQTERNFLKERLDQALHEIDLLRKQDPKKYVELEKEYRDVLEREQIAKGHVSELASRISDLEKELESTITREKNAQSHVQELGNQLERREKENPEAREMLKNAEDKIAHLSQIEPLYRQLKKQFEEKNKVLEETRKNLFETDTELQKFKMDQKALEISPLAKDLEKEFETLSKKIFLLEEENQQLQELVSNLSQNPEQKKK